MFLILVVFDFADMILIGGPTPRVPFIDYVPEPQAQVGSATCTSGFPLHGGHAHNTELLLPGNIKHGSRISQSILRIQQGGPKLV